MPLMPSGSNAFTSSRSRAASIVSRRGLPPERVWVYDAVKHSACDGSVLRALTGLTVQEGRLRPRARIRPRQLSGLLGMTRAATNATASIAAMKS
jgi:hypothetical protein